jgi:hypothetical protein
MINTLKKVARLVPGLRWAYRKAYNLSLRLKSPEEVFTDIYRNNKWSGSDSVSGIGSDAVQTKVIVERIPSLLAEIGAGSVLDIPCGDFFWMQGVDLAGVTYVGADIVQDIVDANMRRYAKPGVEFRRLDLTSDELPRAELVLVRDCLVHLSYEDIWRAIRNIRASGARYLLATTFPHRSNTNIPTGRWRPLNLQAPPFDFPAPQLLINEGCTEADGKFTDKSLALWRVDDIPDPTGPRR